MDDDDEPAAAFRDAFKAQLAHLETAAAVAPLARAIKLLAERELAFEGRLAPIEAAGPAPPLEAVLAGVTRALRVGLRREDSRPQDMAPRASES